MQATAGLFLTLPYGSSAASLCRVATLLKDQSFTARYVLL